MEAYALSQMGNADGPRERMAIFSGASYDAKADRAAKGNAGQVPMAVLALWM
jgi:hypothetical protein